MAMIASQYTGFSSGLLETLAETRESLDDYVQQRKVIIDEEVEAHNQRITRHQEKIQEAQERLASLRSERGVQDSKEGISQRSAELVETLQHLKCKIDSMKQQVGKQSKYLQDLKEEERSNKEKAGEARLLRDRAEENMKITIDDLTRGTSSYKHLGLEFVKGEGCKLCFKFTQIDAGDPKREFSFSLNVNDEDLYIVDDYEHLDEAQVNVLLKDLNDTDDMSAFCLGMRQAFCQTV